MFIGSQETPQATRGAPCPTPAALTANRVHLSSAAEEADSPVCWQSKWTLVRAGMTCEGPAAPRIQQGGETRPGRGAGARGGRAWAAGAGSGGRLVRAGARTSQPWRRPQRERGTGQTRSWKWPLLASGTQGQGQVTVQERPEVISGQDRAATASVQLSLAEHRPTAGLTVRVLGVWDERRLPWGGDRRADDPVTFRALSDRGGGGATA